MKKWLISIPLLSGVIILLLITGAGTALAAPSDPPAPIPHLICSSDTPPRGWVITERKTDWGSCSGNPLTTDNVLAIAPPPTQAISVCSPSPIPSDFVVTGLYPSTMCSLLPNPHDGFSVTNATREDIQPVQAVSQLEVCGSSPIPSDFVVTAETPFSLQSKLCVPDTLGKKYTRQITRVTGAVMRTCADSPLPPGYTTLASDVFLAVCPNDAGTSHLIAPSIS